MNFTQYPPFGRDVTPIKSLLSTHLGSGAVLGVLRFPEGEWNIAVFDHMLDLSPHCTLVNMCFPDFCLSIWHEENLLVNANRINQ